MKKYTLIELLVAMGIFAFMMLLLMNFFGISSDLLGRENNRATKLYEASIFTTVFKNDLQNMQVDPAGGRVFDYIYNGGDFTLRIMTNGYDNNGSNGAIMVSYKYNSTTFELTRYAISEADFLTDSSASSLTDTLTVWDNTNKQINNSDWESFVEVGNNGSVILESVESLYLRIYSENDFQTFDDLDGNNLSPATESNTNLISRQVLPDAINFTMELNNKTALENGNANLKLQNRRTVSQQFLIGY